MMAIRMKAMTVARKSTGLSLASTLVRSPPLLFVRVFSTPRSPSSAGLTPIPVRYRPFPTKLEKLADTFNHAITHYPVDLLASMFALEMASGLLIFHTLPVLGLHYSVNFIWAYAATAALRKIPLVKLLVSHPITMTLSFCFPPLRFIQLSHLRESPAFAALRQRLGVDNKSRTGRLKSHMRVILEPVTNFISAYFARYGILPVMSYRLAGTAMVLVAYYYIEGVMKEKQEGKPKGLRGMVTDVNEHIDALAKNYLGGRSANGNLFATVALSGLVWPALVMASPIMARRIFTMRQQISNRIRSK